MRRHFTVTVFAISLICGCSYFPALAQTAPAPQTTVQGTPAPQPTVQGVPAQPATVWTPKAAAAQDKRRTQVYPRNNNQIIVENQIIAPQIVTILHRLSGLKVMRLLRRSTEEPGSIAGLDDAFRLSKEVHTNVIAGLTLDDGETIAAWLPEAEAEMAPSALQYVPAPDDASSTAIP